ncbi:MAG: transcription-repair coupling factor [Bacilli bacterium]|nr:transcription-repair coupling factor [Bacilli bacterium]
MHNLYKKALEYFDLNDKLKSQNFVVDQFVGTTLLTLKKRTNSSENLAIYAQNSYYANILYQKITSVIDKEHVVLLPGNDFVRVEYLSESKELRSELIYGLYRLRHEQHLIVILTPSSLMRFYPSVKQFDSLFINLSVGDIIEIDDLREKLTRLGYIRVSKIDQSLEFASRGEIIDVFSLNYDKPIRIEFFDNEIESIRLFDIDTQISSEKLTECKIIPATIDVLGKEDLSNAKNKILNQFKKDCINKNDKEKERLEANINSDLLDILSGNISYKNYKYIGFLQAFHTELTDYLSNYSVIIASKDDFLKSKEALLNESRKFLLELQSDNKCISHLEYFNERAALFTGQNNLYTLNSFYLDKNDISIPLRSISEFNFKTENAKNLIEYYLVQKNKILIVAKDENQKKRVTNLLEEMGEAYVLTDDFNISDDVNISLTTKDFGLSFEFTKEKFVILSSPDLFKEKNHLATYSTKFKEGKIIESYEELEPGEFVVHEKYGIGKFSKIETVDLNGIKNDYIEIIYANEDKLYVPLYQFNLIRKYAGKEGANPRLNNLNSKQREKTKKRIKERINDLADRLLTLYQERAKVPGFAFEKDDDLQREFEVSFEHKLTKDQEKSLEEIKKDMESSQPMDRLLCGDVGFGKTEVALEAAMKAVLSGKQVCFLCPTTILASQHYKVALDRFKEFPVNIKILTRMNTESEEKVIKNGVSAGKIDILIGTHKLLSKSVQFKNLGLLIVDEEQRFGVEQKEKIKEIYTNIDVLTLSATPIPRTLQSSLIGLKNISTIETAPEGRMPVQTYVINYDENAIKDIISRELGRQGQVFYVYNEIATIYNKALKLQKLLPTAKIAIIHAKMDKEEVDNVMSDFYEGNIDVLLATTIIENGIDVRNANLLIVENADKFGLAQLYQIKGRVGRGDRIAFAYLTIQENKKLTEEAKKRLKAIQDFTELGSGYKIAQRDLLIRGAGDILGPEQAGFIDSVGIDMYIRLLNETIREKQEGKVKEDKNKKNEINQISAFIPKKFANSEEKIEIYQKIVTTTTLEQLAILERDLKDQFGNLPDSTRSLFVKRMIDIYLTFDEFKEFLNYEKYIDIILNGCFSEINGIGTSLFTSLIQYTNRIKMSYRNKLIHISINKDDEWINTLINVLKITHQVYQSRRKAAFVDEN